MMQTHNSLLKKSVNQINDLLHVFLAYAYCICLQNNFKVLYRGGHYVDYLVYLLVPEPWDVELAYLVKQFLGIFVRGNLCKVLFSLLGPVIQFLVSFLYLCKGFLKLVRIDGCFGYYLDCHFSLLITSDERDAR